MDFRFNGNKPKKVIYNNHNLKQIDVVKNGARSTVWKSELILFLGGTTNPLITGWTNFSTDNDNKKYWVGGSNAIFRGRTNNAIDCTGFDKLSMDYKLKCENAYVTTYRIGISSNTSDNNFAYSNTVTDVNGNTISGHIEIDISGNTGLNYLKWYTQAPINGGTPRHYIWLDNIKLE